MKTALAVLALVAVTAFAACKGETKYQDKPETIADLSRTTNLVNEQDKRIKQLEARVAELAAGACEEVVIRVDGDAVSVVTGKGPSGVSRPKDPTGDARDAELYNAFRDQVQSSRGAIKRCYQNALKKDSSLEQRTITVNITVKYKSSGKVSDVMLDKRVSDNFAACLESTASSWTLPAAPKAFTFKAPVSLTPQ